MAENGAISEPSWASNLVIAELASLASARRRVSSAGERVAMYGTTAAL